MEGIVRNGQFFTVGNNGAEFIDVQPNDIIFNHEQTKMLLEKGRITSRGKAYANGTANTIPLEVADPVRYKEMKEFQEKFSKLVMPNTFNHAFVAQAKQLEKSMNQVMNVTMKENNTPVEVRFGSVNINCPNVTNDAGVRYIEKELSNLSLKGLQYFKTRR